MASDDLTIRILQDIREQVTQTNSRLDVLTARVDESEVRTVTAMQDMVTTNREISALLRDRFDLRDRVERCERELAKLKRRVG